MEINKNIKNRNSCYYTEVGSYHGAIKLAGKWNRAMNLNYIDKSKMIRWSGPPSLAIIKALRSNFIN